MQERTINEPGRMGRKHKWPLFCCEEGGVCTDT